MNVQEVNEFFKELDKLNKQLEEDYYGKKYEGSKGEEERS